MTRYRRRRWSLWLQCLLDGHCWVPARSKVSPTWWFCARCNKRRGIVP